MNELKIFDNPEFGQIRTVEIDDEPWLVGKDVAEALGYSNPRDALANHVDSEDKATVAVHDGSQNRNMTIINESGLYSLILSSKISTAKKFKHWVTKEVLPSIRKNGGYIHTTSDMTDAEIMAKAVVVAQRTIAEREERIKNLEAENKLLEGKAQYFDFVVDRGLLTNFRDTAKELHVKQSEFIKFLEDSKYIYRDTKGHIKPYSIHCPELFEIKDQTNQKNKWAGPQTFVTPKGKETFRLLMKAKKNK